MVQWTNFLHITRFINPMQLYISYKKSGGLRLAELGLAVADSQIKFQIFKAWCRSDYSIFAKVQHCFSKLNIFI